MFAQVHWDEECQTRYTGIRNVWPGKLGLECLTRYTGMRMSSQIHLKGMSGQLQWNVECLARYTG
jgi:hypothetical protein